jgi:redox-regulated HSP33 family molecular chaperone
MLVSCWQNPINGDPYSSAVPISGPEYSIPQHKTAEVESSNQLSTTLPLLIPSPGQSVIDKFTATSEMALHMLPQQTGLCCTNFHRIRYLEEQQKGRWVICLHFFFR